MSGTVLLIVQRPESRPGEVMSALGAKGCDTEVCCPKAGDALPDTLEKYAGAVMFGGPMSANDDSLPFIRAELDWLPLAIDSGTPFLGICLGAQMLARCLGATVAPHPDGLHDIGYFRVEPAPNGNHVFREPFHAYHWNSEGFALPAGATLLATGEAFAVQAFRYGRAAYGVQFHPEMQEEILRTWMEKAAHKLNFPGAQQPDVQLAGHARHGAAVRRWLDGFLDVWLAGNGA